MKRKLAKSSLTSAPRKPAKRVPKPAPRKPVKRAPKPAPRKPGKRAPKPIPRKPAKRALKPAPRKPGKRAPKPAPRKPVKRAPKPVPRKPVKRAPKPAPRKPVKRAPKPVPRKPVKRPPKPVPRKPVKRAPKPVPRKPVKRAPKPPPRKSVKRAPKPTPRKPVKRAPKPVPRKPVKRAPKPAPRKPVRRKPIPRQPLKYPSFIASAAEAESLLLDWLGRLQDVLLMGEPELDMDAKSFINRDSTVDGELRLRNLPDEWRSVEGMPYLVAALSEAIRAVGPLPRRLRGGFWISFGLRFGPKDQGEVEEMAKFYKRFRGLFQVGAYHTSAESVPAILNNALAVRDLVERVMAKRDLPPVQLLVRIVWTPDGKRPGRFAGEEGSKE